MKKLRNTEAELEKSVPYIMKKRVFKFHNEGTRATTMYIKSSKFRGGGESYQEGRAGNFDFSKFCQRVLQVSNKSKQLCQN